MRSSSVRTALLVSLPFGILLVATGVLAGNAPEQLDKTAPSTSSQKKPAPAPTTAPKKPGDDSQPPKK